MYVFVFGGRYSTVRARVYILHTHIYRVYIQIDKNTYKHTHMYIEYIYKHTKIYINALSHTHTHDAGLQWEVHIHTHAHTPLHTHTHTYTHNVTRMLIQMQTLRNMDRCYGVATMSRLLTIIGLFCKRTL